MASYQTLSVNPDGPSHEERWQAFCASIVDRIEAIRSDTAPDACSLCGTSSAPPLAHKRCSHCLKWKSVAAFSLDRRKVSSLYQSWCRACKSQQQAEVRRRRALRAIGLAS